MNFQRDKYLLPIVFLLFIFLILRSFKVGITADEAWTIRDYVTQSYNAIFSCTPCDANNHILNSALSRISYRIGFTEFWARLPNLIAGFIFLLFTYKLAIMYFKGVLRFTFFLLLTLNPFMLEFFALSRGYGLALCFTLTSVYFLLKFNKESQNRQLLLILILSALAVLSNFSYLNYFLSILCVLIYIAWINKYPIQKFLLYSLTVVFLLGMTIWTPMEKLIKGGNFTFGGNEGVFWDSFYSLTRSSLYNPQEFEWSYIILKIATLISAIILILRILSAKSISGFAKSNEFVVTLLFLLPLLANSLQHYLFDTKFLVERTALFYYILLVLCLAFLTHSIKQRGLKRIGVVLFSIATLFMAFNFIININLYKTVSWYFDAHTEEAFEIINESVENPGEKLTLNTDWLMRSSAQYIQENKEYSNVYYDVYQINNNDFITDFYLHLSVDFVEHGYFSKEQPILKMDYDTIRSWPEEGVHLFKLRK